MTLKEDINRLAKSLLQEIEIGNDAATIYSLSDIHLGPEDLYYEHSQTVTEMGKLGLLKILSQKMGEKVDPSHLPVFYEVKPFKKKLIDYLLREEDEAFKESYGLKKQASVVANSIVKRLLKYEKEKEISFKKTDISKKHRPHIQIARILRFLQKERLIKIEAINFVDEAFVFNLDVGTLFNRYEAGDNLFSTTHVLGNKAFNFNTKTLEFRWGKVKGKLNKRSSDIFELLVYFLNHPDEWIDAKTIGKYLFTGDAFRTKQVEDAVGNLRKKLGLTKDDRECPGNIIRDKNRYKLCLQAS